MFVENRTVLAPAWSVVTALRYDDLKLEGTNLRPETISATNPAYFKRTYRPVTGRAAVVFDIARDANLYAQASTAADPPAGLLATAAFSQVLDFDLTTGRQFEVGSKFNFAQGRGAATLALYRITRKNLAMTDPANPLATIPIGQQSAAGVEATVSLRPTNTVLLEANVAYVDAQFDELFERVGTASVSRTGNKPPNVPAVVGNLWASWKPLPNVTVGADARYVSRRYGNTSNSVWDRAYTLVGAFARYQLTPAIELSVRGRNLADRVYASAVTGTPMFYLGVPRSFEVGIHARF